MEITSKTKVYQIIKQFPELSVFFSDLGICGCGLPQESDYFWSLERVAKEKGIDLEALIKDIKKRIEDQS